MRSRHIIFDCDGVLLDSEVISMRVDQMLLEQCGVRMSFEELHQRFVGMTFAGMVEIVEAEQGIRLPTDLEARKDDLMLDMYRRELRPVNNVARALDAISLPKSIGTNGPRQRALAALEIVGLRHHFGDRLTTFEDVTHGKPAPDIYLLAAQRAGTPPSDCLVVEDSVTGATAAASAGCRVLGFTGTHENRAEHALKLAACGCARIFDDMIDLPAIVRSFT